jgi:chloride channel protein, CIC family
VFAFEITRDYNAILPLMLGCVVADIIALHYLPSSIMTKKLARRGLSVPEYYEAGALNVVRVSEVMRKDVQPIPPEMTVGEMAERMAQREPGYDITEGLPIASGDGRLVGIVTQGDLLRALEKDPVGRMAVSEAGTMNPAVAFPDELVYEALFRMLRRDIGRLPVVSRERPEKIVGYLNRASILSAWTRQMHEEGHREHGWLRTLYRKRKDPAPLDAQSDLRERQSHRG